MVSPNYSCWGEGSSQGISSQHQHLTGVEAMPNSVPYFGARVNMMTNQGVRKEFGDGGTSNSENSQYVLMSGPQFLSQMDGSRKMRNNGSEGGAGGQRLPCSKCKEVGHVNKYCRKYVHSYVYGKESHL